MVIEFPYCSFKCDKECGQQVCQNSALTEAQNITISIDKIITRYINNPITKAIVCQGLEPFDSKDDLYVFLDRFRRQSNDDVVIYTGYTKEELQSELHILESFGNIIIKFGRFIPNQLSHFDDILGVQLASPNQYAECI